MIDIELAVLLFSITLAVQVVGWIGKETLAEWAYIPVSTLFGPSMTKEQRAQRAQILQLRAELAATSSQDEFSKWARIRRKLDKSVSELESTNAATLQHKQQFAAMFKKFLWVLTTILPFVVTSWHRKSAVFYLPPGWFGPAAWYMSLPSGPRGGVACGIWTMACKRTLSTVKDIVVELTGLNSVEQQQQQAPVPVAVPVGGGPGGGGRENKVEKDDEEVKAPSPALAGETLRDEL